MKRAQKIAFAAIFAMAALVVVFVLRNRMAPPMPPGTEHIWKGEEDCLLCHGPNGGLPRSPNHVVDRDCLRCHAATR